MKRENILVLGGSGFLGSHVADALTNLGFQVRIFDQRPSCYLNESQEMILGDVMDLNAVIAAAKDCQYVYHFAGLADIDQAKDRPIDTAQFNILGTIHALEAARLAGAKRFILASSVYVYSDIGSFYSASKLGAERFVEAYHERYGLNYSILRYGSLYGRRADSRNGIYRFLKQALDQRVILYKGKPTAVREYIHVLDAARLSAKILTPEYENGHYILTGHERMSVQEFLKMIAEIVPHTLTIQFDEQAAHGHYEMTPYSFQPRLGKKLIDYSYIDLGQGLMDCLSELHEENQNQIPIETVVC